MDARSLRPEEGAGSMTRGDRKSPDGQPASLQCQIVAQDRFTSVYTYRVSSPAFSSAVQRAVDSGLAAAAILDRDGNAIAVAGALADDEVRPIAGVVTHCLKGEDLATRMFAGEMVSFPLDDRDVSVG